MLSDDDDKVIILSMNAPNDEILAWRKAGYSPVFVSEGESAATSYTRAPVGGAMRGKDSV